MTKKLHIFDDKTLNKQLLKISIPIALQNLMYALVAAADALMLGAVEQNQMSAVSLATQIQFIQNMLFYSLVCVMQLLGAQYYGKKEYRGVGDVFAIGIRLSLVVSIVFFLGCELIPEQLMKLFTNDSQLIEYGVKYLKIAGWSYLLTGVSQSYHCLFKTAGHPKEATKIAVVIVLLNILLNACFIYGLWFFPKLGLEGAAIATLISRIIEIIWTINISFKKGYIRPTLKQLVSFNKVLQKDFYHHLLPITGASILWGVGFTAYTSFMGHLGTDAPAANSIASVIRDLVCCLCNGLAAGAGLCVGYELGQGNCEKGKEYADRILWMSIICGIISTILMLCLTPLIVGFVKLTPEASKLLIGMMLIMGLYMIGRAINGIIINGIFASGGDTTFDLVSLIICMWGLAVPLAALGTYVFHWNPLLVYIMTCLDEVGKVPFVILHFKKYKWVKDLTKEY